MSSYKGDTIRQRWKYIISDFIASNVTWFIMNLARYHALGRHHFSSRYDYLTDKYLVIGQILIPIFWIIIFYYSGYYNKTAMKSRLIELKSTLFSVFYGTIIIFFSMMINDLPFNYLSYYKLIAILFVGQFTLTYIPRAVITAIQTRKIHSRKKGYNTLIIGNGICAVETIDELDKMRQGMGYFIKGVIEMDDCNNSVDKSLIIGKSKDIDRIIKEQRIEKIIIAPDNQSNENIAKYLDLLYQYNISIYLKANRDYILTHSTRISTIYASTLVEVNKDNMPESQKNVKQTIDYVISAITLIIISPLLLWLAFKVKKSSEGPIFYRQERLGKYGKPFTIYKFRTMYTDSENNGPALSSDKDKRITPFGKTMRKYRLDELPQFWNVLKGDMSLVGPRPERKFYAEQIVKQAPYYRQIYTVKPGITSWGMVKYGYANSIEQMIERLEYDIIYLDNRSLIVDTKILIYTAKTILTGKGI